MKNAQREENSKIKLLKIKTRNSPYSMQYLQASKCIKISRMLRKLKHFAIYLRNRIICVCMV